MPSQQIDYIVSIDCPGFSVWENDSQLNSALILPDSTIRSIGHIYGFSEFNVYINLNKENHQISLYFVDYDNGGRNQIIEIYDHANRLLHQKYIEQFQNGIYLKCKGYGGFCVRVYSNNPSQNVVLSSVFFD